MGILYIIGGDTCLNFINVAGQIWFMDFFLGGMNISFFELLESHEIVSSLSEKSSQFHDLNFFLAILAK